MAAGTLGFKGRISSEISSFKRDEKCSTPLLKLAVLKYGLSSFHVYELLEFEGSDDVFGMIEQSLIKSFNSQTPYGYNITSGDKGTLGFSNHAWSNARRGVKRPDVSQKRASRYEMLSPEGEHYYISNMKSFCKDLNLNPSTMINVAKGKYGYTSHKGWTAATITREAYSKKLSKEAYFVSPNNELICVKNIKQFAIANVGKYSQSHLTWLWNRRSNYLTHKNWRRSTDKEILEFDPAIHKTWEYDRWL